MATPIRSDQILSVWWQQQLDRLGGAVEDAADIDQAIKIILVTPYGSDPHRPDFGSNLISYIDWPVERATPHVVRESIAAIEKWEPRIFVESIDVEPYKESLSSLTITVNWGIEDSNIFGQQTAVEVAL